MKNLNDSLRGFLHLIDDGGKTTLYVAESEKHNPDVIAYIAGLIYQSEHRNMAIEYTSLAELEEHRQRGRTGNRHGAILSDLQELVLSLFERAVKLHSSDIHMIIQKGITRIQMRVHGDLEDQSDFEMTGSRGMDTASTICMSMCDVAEKQFFENQRQNGRIKEEFLEMVGLFGARYSHRPIVGGLLVVMRVIPRESGSPPTLTSLGFLPGQIRAIINIMSRPEGLFLNAGPVGQGKSTTIRAVCNEYMQRHGGKHRLLTVEDPPEGEIPGAVHSPILCDKSDPEAVSQEWVNSLSNTLRQDYNLLFVGEVQDGNSAQAVIRAVLQGRPVVTTIHSPSNTGTLDRLLIEGVQEGYVTDHKIIIGLLSQRLVKLTCPHCGMTFADKKAQLSPEELTQLEKYCPDLNALKFIHPDGCEHCFHGVSGRTVIAEIVQPDAEFMRLYREKDTGAARRYWKEHLGGISRAEHLLQRVNEGLVDPLIAETVCPLDDDKWQEG